MSPALVSECLEYTGQFQHRDIAMHSVAALEQQRCIEKLMMAARFHDTSGFEKSDLPALGNLSPGNVIGRPPVSRRHSSSNFNTTTTTKVPLMTHFTETSIYSNLSGNPLETLLEERFRSRAFSEGSALLNNNDAYHEQQQLQQVQTATSRYKTELCRPFEESGKCKYGDKCQFAHGKHELRQMVRHPKYKTELCRTYHSSGLCPYGPRCHFIHNQDETPAAQPPPSSAAPAIQRSVSMAVPIRSPTQRPGGVNRPTNLQLANQQRGGNRVNVFSYSPPFVSSPVMDPGTQYLGMNDAGLMSPISPLAKSNGQIFSYVQAPPLSPMDRKMAPANIPDFRQPSPPLTQLDFTPIQRSDLVSTDDMVFDRIPTPPDSDRESATASPPGFGGQISSGPQRLPIFRCLSQSE